MMILIFRTPAIHIDSFFGLHEKIESLRPDTEPGLRAGLCTPSNTAKFRKYTDCQAIEAIWGSARSAAADYRLENLRNEWAIENKKAL